MMPSRILTTTIAALMLGVAACATTGRQASPDTARTDSASQDAAARDTTARGVVRVVGAVPRTTVLLRSEDRQVVLTGPLVSELATLDGAEVVVSGPVGPGTVPVHRDGRSIAVHGYEIESIAGGKPVVGILRADSAGARVDSIPLVSLPAALGRFIGGKVWVVGTRTDSGALRVEAFGVLRRASGTTPDP